MTPVTDPQAYDLSLEILARHKDQVGREFKGRFIQIFLGLKFWQDAVPSMYSGQFIETEILQTLLDDLYAKASRPANHGVLALFENDYHARTGLTKPGNTTPQNTWRNNFNLQKGVGCYAPPQDLSSNTFLNQSRTQCRYLRTAQAGSLNRATCRLCPTGASYRKEDHRKWLRIDPGGSGYAVVDLLNVHNFAPYVAPAGNRIPVFPLILALYHDGSPGLVVGSRSNIGLDEFRVDFNFSPQEYAAYFDDDVTSPLNQELLQAFPLTGVAGTGGLSAPAPASWPARAPRRPIPPPTLTGTPVTPPRAHSGFDAELFVAKALEAAGWTVHQVSRQQVGYDLLIQKARQTRFIEVKSSLGSCTPSLTTREWTQAQHHGRDYVLAIIENFDPAGRNVIYWVPDPANSCSGTASTTVNYAISRSSWSATTVALARI